MKINATDNSIDQRQTRQIAHNLTASANKQEDSVGKREAPKATRDTVQASQTQRRPPLTQILNRSLTDAGIQVGAQNLVQAADAASSAQSSNDLEMAQSEKVAQALQAFMHTLVQATANDQNKRSIAPVSTTSSTSDSSSNPPMPTPASSSAYTGLVSRLEALAQKLDNPANSDVSRPGVSDLDSAFRSLLAASGIEQPSGSTSVPQLQEVIRNIARNLQSTGNPNLATTGNVINTAA